MTDDGQPPQLVYGCGNAVQLLDVVKTSEGFFLTVVETRKRHVMARTHTARSCVQECLPDSLTLVRRE